MSREPREPVAGYFRVTDPDQHYPGLRIDVFQIAAMWLGPAYRVVVELTSGQSHTVTPPAADYQAGLVELDKFEAVVGKLRRVAVRSGTR